MHVGRAYLDASLPPCDVAPLPSHAILVQGQLPFQLNVFWLVACGFWFLLPDSGLLCKMAGVLMGVTIAAAARLIG